MMPHWIIDVVGTAAPIIGGLLFVVQLLVNRGVSSTNALIREHIARDEEKHKAIDGHLEATDARVDRLDNRWYNHERHPEH